MIYYYRKTSLKIGQFEIPNELNLDWEYESKADSTSSSLILNIVNLSTKTISNIKKGDIVEFGFGYEDQTTPFFYGVVDSHQPENRGLSKVLAIKCLEYNNSVKKKLSRSYVPGSFASYVIKDIATLCGLDIELLDLGTDTKFNNGYNVYDLPIIALKKLCKNAGSDLIINGNKITVSTGKKGVSRGISFDYTSGLLAPINAIQSSLLDESEYGKQKKREDLAKVKSTHKLTTLANPEVKKNDVVEVLEELYKVVGFTIRNWKFEGEVFKLG